VTLLTPVKWRTRRYKAVLHNDGNGVSQDLVFGLSPSHLDALTCRSTQPKMAALWRIPTRVLSVMVQEEPGLISASQRRRP
jgi:hypothetical protein